MEFEKERQNVGEGWQPLVQEVHDALTELLGEYDLLQIKEKFGGLRYYFGAPHGSTMENRELASQRVLSAEELSFKVCEQCGAKGYLKQHRGWLVTLCDQHHEDREFELGKQAQG